MPAWNDISNHSQTGTTIVTKDNLLFLGIGNGYTAAVSNHRPFESLDVEYIKILFELTKTFQKKLQNLHKDQRAIDDLLKVVSLLDSILFIKAEGGYCKIYTKTGKTADVLNIPLKKIVLYISDTNLLQVHRSYLVNPRKVTGVVRSDQKKCTIHFNNETVPIGKTYLKPLKVKHPDWFPAIQT